MNWVVTPWFRGDLPLNQGLAWQQPVCWCAVDPEQEEESRAWRA